MYIYENVSSLLFATCRMQSYYGLAIRRSIGEWQKMRENAVAILYHMCEAGEENCSMSYNCHRHDGGKDAIHLPCAKTARDCHAHCPDGAESWCKWKRDLVRHFSVNFWVIYCYSVCFISVGCRSSTHCKAAPRLFP